MPTREETKLSDLHIQSPMTKGTDNRDRMYLEDIGLTLDDMRTPVVVWRACERFWGYPVGSLTDYVVAETTRSLQENREAREFVVAPPTVTTVAMEAMLPRRVDYQEFNRTRGN